jgi:hypothetical protein
LASFWYPVQARFSLSNNHRHSGPPNISQCVIASFHHPILPTVQGEPYYQTIHAIRKLLQANARAIDTHLGGGALGHLGLIVLDSLYAMIAPVTESGPTLWKSPTAPGRVPGNTDGTAAQISVARHTWDEEVQTYHTYTAVQQALKNGLSLFFNPCIWTF